jgi:hypothetical protein
MKTILFLAALALFIHACTPADPPIGNVIMTDAGTISGVCI